MLKINRDGIVSDSADVREHPGTGVPMEAVEHPADGTMSPMVGDDEPVPAEVPGDAPVVAPEAEAEAAPAAPAAPPRTPPRRPPAVQRE